MYISHSIPYTARRNLKPFFPKVRLLFLAIFQNKITTILVIIGGGDPVFCFRDPLCIRVVQNNFEKNLYFQKYSVFTTALLRYLPLSTTHFAQHLCQLSSMCWNLFCVICLKVISAALNTACRDSKRRLLRSLLPIRNRKRSQGVRSGLSVVWRITSKLYEVKKSRTHWTMRWHMLSWWNFHWLL